VRCLCGVARRIDAEALTRGTPALVPGLVRAFNSQSADVRKAVVDAIVAMYDQLGDWLLPQFAGLTAAQQKLVTIYINRATEAGGAKKGGRRGGGGGAGSAGGGDQGARVPLAPRQMQ
jgi:CLIP-associating protein 1/2